MKKRIGKVTATIAALAMLIAATSCDFYNPDDTGINETPEVEKPADQGPNQESNQGANQQTATKQKAATPVITVADNKVTIASATKDAVIYYTTDGKAPTTESSKYSAPFAITADTTVKAIATCANYNDSDIASKECAYEKPVAAKPVIANSDNTITITCETEGAVIYYTLDGNAPTAESTKYEAPFAITENVTIKAIAIKDGFTSSEVSEQAEEYVAPGEVGKPKITQTKTQVTITCSTPDAVIYYTLDESDPTTSSTKYENPITLTAKTTVKAIAVKDDKSSGVVTLVCEMPVQNATPVISDVTDNKVTITCATEGAVIYYTTDGTVPTASSTKYTEEITLTATVTIKAIALKDGNIDSTVAEKECAYTAPVVVDFGLLTAAVDLDWGAGAILESTQLSNAENNTKLMFTYVSNEQTLEYYKFKLAVNSEPRIELYEGAETSFTIDRTSTKPDDLHGCSPTKAPSETESTFCYQPSVAEWGQLKTSGFIIYGYGIKITKIELAEGGEAITETTSNNSSETVTPSVIWEGSSEIAWSLGNASGVALDNAALFPEEVKGIKITYSTDDTNSHCIKILQANTWNDITLETVEGAGSIRNNTTKPDPDNGKAIDLWKTQTDAIVTVHWTTTAAEDIIGHGIKVYGDGATITKIETVLE